MVSHMIKIPCIPSGRFGKPRLARHAANQPGRKRAWPGRRRCPEMACCLAAAVFAQVKGLLLSLTLVLDIR